MYRLINSPKPVSRFFNNLCLSQVKEQMDSLPIGPDTRLRLIVSEQEAENEAQAFIPSEFRNGVGLLPRREVTARITTELINHLIEAEDEEEALRAHRASGR